VFIPWADVERVVLYPRPGSPTWRIGIQRRLGVPGTARGRDDAWRAWRGEVAFAEKFVADSPDLGVKGVDPEGSSPELRSVLVHMIEEYARHCGHADLLRERVNGRIGQ
jgi:hypothetical protein